MLVVVSILAWFGTACAINTLLLADFDFYMVGPGCVWGGVVVVVVVVLTLTRRRMVWDGCVGCWRRRLPQ